MFTFKPYDDSDINGWRKDDLKEDQKNEFHFSIHCKGLEKLDNILFVRMSKQNIQFICESDEVWEAYVGRVVATISLTNPKDTGHDLLYFGEFIQNDSITGRLGVDKSKLNEFMCRAEAIFRGFPFLSNNRGCENNYDKAFLRLCLLEFLLAVDTHDEIFAVTPDYDEIRKTLRNSKVYRLLCAKLRYCMYKYEGREALNEEEYSFVVSKFSDLLMDADYNKMVPPDYYDEPRFFYNPEVELKMIMKNRDSEIIGLAVKEKIKSFFLTKHAVTESFLCVSKRKTLTLVFKYVHAGLMLLWVVWTLFSFFYFERFDAIINAFYNSNALMSPLLIITGLLVAFEVGFSITRFNSIVFHPRIVVALLMGWFTIAISEDLIKSQLELTSQLVFLSLLVVLFLVGMMLWAEVRQHSPYYLRWFSQLKLFVRRISHGPKKRLFTTSPKIIYILVYSMFWNLLLGTGLQMLTYNRLLDASGTLPNVMLGVLHDNINKYKKSVEICINMLDDYDMSMEGILHDYGKTNLRVDFHAKSDTVMEGVAKATNGNNTNDNGIDIVKLHNDYFDQISNWLVMAESNIGMRFKCVNDSCWITKNPDAYNMSDNSSDCWLICKDGSGMKVMKVKLVDTIAHSFSEKEHFPGWVGLFDMVQSSSLKLSKNDAKAQIGRNLDSARINKNRLRAQLLEIDKFMSEVSNQYVLEEWTKVIETDTTSKKHIPTHNYYLACIGYEAAVQHKFCRDMKIINGSQPIFPRMLIFHSLIVLILSFVGQLIISDKSVTEPL